MSSYILGIESSCDDTSAAVLKDSILCSNIISSQKIHEQYGGVVPELASRSHLQNIVPVIDTAIKNANINKSQISAIAFTRGPGLLGSLLVGTSFAKALAYGLNVPLIEVDHLQAHVLSHFIQLSEDVKEVPTFPFLCLTVSGGHTQILLIKDYFDFEIIGQTIDDAAGEAFDKAAKILGLPYPGGPLIDALAKEGNPHAFKFSEANLPNFDFSFSGLKTSFLYFLRDNLKKDENFIEKNKADLAASIQNAIIHSLTKKTVVAAKYLNIKQIAIAGGVSANSELRNQFTQIANNENWKLFLPSLQFTTDNAAMIAIVGYFKFLKGDFCSLDSVPYTRYGKG